MSSQGRNMNANMDPPIRRRKKPDRRYTLEEERTLIELYDEALALNNYMFKDPGQPGRAYIVRKFNEKFNQNMKWTDLRCKFDEWKKQYKTWVLLQGKTGITVDPISGRIEASDEWWNDRIKENDKVRRFQREPPKFWEVMRVCFANLDVGSQRQHSVRQRREELMSENVNDIEDTEDANDEENDDDVGLSEVRGTQHENEVYRVNIYDESQPPYQYAREGSQVPERRGRQSSRAAPYSSVGGGSLRGSGSRGSSGSRGPRRRQNFESTIHETMSTIRDFQRKSFERLRPGHYDPEDYDDFDTAVELLNSLEIPEYMGKFYMKCLHLLRHDRFWRRHWMNASHFPTTESRYLFLESLTQCTRYGEETGTPQPSGSSRSTGPSSSGSVSASSSQRSFSIPINPPVPEFRPPGSQTCFQGLGFSSFSGTQGEYPNLGFQTPGRGGGFFNIFGQNDPSTSEHPCVPARQALFQDHSRDEEDD